MRQSIPLTGNPPPERKKFTMKLPLAPVQVIKRHAAAQRRDFNDVIAELLWKAAAELDKQNGESRLDAS